MPEEVPPNISQVFKDIIPFALVILVLYGFDLLSRAALGSNVAHAIIKFFAPLFTAADGYIGITIIFGAFALFWFVGIHGVNMVSGVRDPIFKPLLYAPQMASIFFFHFFVPSSSPYISI